ncbi:MAG: ERCC4 domain-containing protein [Polyangiaceae bacterium]|jgi:ERCC4-type nuclease
MTAAPFLPWTLAIDTREQIPWDFGPHVQTARVTMAAGDYSIVGLETRIAIERKSLADYKGSITFGRERFKRELEILATYEAAFVIVEANLGDIYLDDRHSSVHPNSVFGTTVALTLDYVPVLWAGSRPKAAEYCYRLLKRFWEKRIAPTLAVESAVQR